MPVDPLAGLELNSDTSLALDRAVSERQGHPVGTVGLLRAVVSVDSVGDWAWVQLHTRPLQDDDVVRYGDYSEIEQWRNVPITKQALEGLRVAAWIATAYELLPMPAGILALGVFWSPSGGAARSFLDGSALTHLELVNFVQDAVLHLRLESLETAVDQVQEDAVNVSGSSAAPDSDLAQLEPLLRAAADTSPHTGQSTYVTVTTAAVMLAVIASNRQVWERAAVSAQISLEAYEASLRWACDHSTETIDSVEDDIDRQLDCVRLTNELSMAVGWARCAAEKIAGTERPDVRPILPLAILSVPNADGQRGIRQEERVNLRSALLAVSVGGRVPELDVYFADAKEKSVESQSDLAKAKSEAKKESIGFRVGTFLGAMIVTVLGGMPLGLAWLVQFSVGRARKTPRLRWLLAAAAVAAVVVAITLAVTGRFQGVNASP